MASSAGGGGGKLMISARNASVFAQANPESCKPTITFLDLDVAACVRDANLRLCNAFRKFQR